MSLLSQALFCAVPSTNDFKNQAASYLVHDTLYDRQVLYNGRIWKSRYGQVMGDEFFLTKDWMIGEVTINKKSYSKILLRYDLLNDQLVLMVNPGTAIILSNEKVKSFTLINNSKKYQFINYSDSSSSLLKGYGNLLYNGLTALVVKYSKQIKLLAVENKYDQFYQKQQVFLMKDEQLFRIRSKKELISLLPDHRDEIHKYVRDKGSEITISKPETIIPVLRFYDSLKSAAEK